MFHRELKVGLVSVPFILITSCKPILFFQSQGPTPVDDQSLVYTQTQPRHLSREALSSKLKNLFSGYDPEIPIEAEPLLYERAIIDELISYQPDTFGGACNLYEDATGQYAVENEPCRSSRSRAHLRFQVVPTTPVMGYLARTCYNLFHQEPRSWLIYTLTKPGTGKNCVVFPGTGQGGVPAVYECSGTSGPTEVVGHLVKKVDPTLSVASLDFPNEEQIGRAVELFLDEAADQSVLDAMERLVSESQANGLDGYETWKMVIWTLCTSPLNLQ